ncbi:MAG: ATP-binding cassette domain-containing protein [Synergistaceae bacterium]|nr:ATP-binding cassette domain-containing protein [Synergistaceae bacterium]
MLNICVKKRIGTLDMDISFVVERPLITALFGRSGAGKTTLANMLVGLIRPDAGRIKFENSVYTDTERGINLSPNKRGIGYVFQEHRLFPHMKVKNNLTFGQFPGGRKSRTEFSKIVELLDIGHLTERYPDTLSGGEAQRVAIGRALFACNSFLIMDEPLSSLDSSLKDGLMRYIALIPKNFSFPMIYITHSKEEVKRLAEMVALINNGKLVSYNIPDLVYDQSGIRPFAA